MQQNIINIKALDMDGRGVGHVANEDGTQGKVIFVEGALPGEQVSFQSYRRKPKWEAATMTALHRESSLRVKPQCDYFGLCGGCAMQHLEPSAQVAMKQRVLEDNLWHLSKLKAETMLRPIYGPTWGYRYRARISVKNVVKKGTVLVGFHEKKSPFVSDMKTCEILPPHVSAMLMPLRALIGSLSIVNRLPQIELAIGEGDNGVKTTVMVLRVMEPPSADDEVKLKAFADEHKVEWWLQPKGPDTAHPFYPPQSNLHYTLPEFGIRMPFKPTDFTQVNHQINRVLVARALRLLDVQPEDRVADLFCGLGNFTLPIATLAREVVGIEGSTALTERAAENAKVNAVAGKTAFYCRNLFEATTEDFIALGKFDRMLIDPPREGALEVCKAIAGLSEQHAHLKPKRIVYVSCNPATLARDAGELVNLGGYRLTLAGVVNMFPHTAHVESMAVFDLPD
ncbi:MULTISPECIES: 23S rRNA (uracil(1939)-C(5))-methyltransferase RlmD [unclassified Herbaspirillum]|uniref:23S rRNA (uracil(1939)-C(5))-methyltransferase RlmD n=1 Tax=unclassified Herbaspirillum TaxID=2624150 RepID=UPI000E2ED531|nr:MULTISPECIES: 23S rRNA (uracil(1939)-C(5))-methyltransferase RlmD [unclassified Herbaspirillum]RFB68830.1 23S rRNA (uracil(1939)-C(5))-methyltransferase RlmD [Herbaspirillum sp. 3R-3a1]TFI05737.1 23S rRNA (uracil(1939)-C(5))-methyltransferase RlmD [Herbaspirillum sp. 3R11]TFI13352.1 23S rRNA (uracil(1939)-C(5))-methyltransferase RlmD [Herbaspirillum sp. 3R-11]TFI20776.1 23S rRNA (uracil(1939)-C(5))-methyltransferase RlmD [Herbaspirillum sp. 3C11]